MPGTGFLTLITFKTNGGTYGVVNGGAWVHANNTFCNVAFFDGHVEPVRIDQIPSRQAPNVGATQLEQFKCWGVYWNNQQ